MISLVTEYFLAIALFFSFITLIFYGFPVAWTMGGSGGAFGQGQVALVADMGGNMTSG